MKMKRSEELFKKARNLIPGGVNSPVRAFSGVGGNPVFMKKASGAYLFDEDGNKYIDYIGSWGPMLLGHAHPDVVDAIQKAAANSSSFGTPTATEVQMAELVTELCPNVEMVRMVNSGTEATMSAIRLSRGYTKRNKIIKFRGCYHGHGDSFLIEAGSGALTLGIPSSPGVTPGTASDTLSAEYNSLESVDALFRANPDEIAAVIVEPVAGNMGCIPPKPGFLEGLRTRCTAEGALLIFDEVMTGFRIHPGGAQALFDVQADIVAYGKIIGGGMPVGAYAGSREVMNTVAPAGPVYQAGTLSGNPVAMAAGFATLSIIKSNKEEIYTTLESRSALLESGLSRALSEKGIPYVLHRVGAMLGLFLNVESVWNFSDALETDSVLFGKIFRSLLQNGVYFAPSAYEALFLGTTHSEEDIHHTVEVFRNALKHI